MSGPMPAQGTIEAFLIDLLVAGARRTLTSPIPTFDGWPPCTFAAYAKRAAASEFLDWIWACECATWGMGA